MIWAENGIYNEIEKTFFILWSYAASFNYIKLRIKWYKYKYSLNIKYAWILYSNRTYVDNGLIYDILVWISKLSWFSSVIINIIVFSTRTSSIHPCISLYSLAYSRDDTYLYTHTIAHNTHTSVIWNAK